MKSILRNCSFRHSAFFVAPYIVVTSYVFVDEGQEPREREPVYRTLYRYTTHFYRDGLLHPQKPEGNATSLY